LIYFTSNSDSSKGKHDIFTTKLNEDGKWSAPESITELNTENDENYVYIDSTGKILYFSSDRDGGKGKYDIYKSELDESGKWSAPISLEAPYNSEYNDIQFIMDPEGVEYFASDRSDTAATDYNIFMVLHPVVEDKIYPVPIVLTEESKLEENETGEIIKIKDTVYLKGPEELIPDSVMVDKSKIFDSTDLVFVKDLEIDSMLVVLDSADEQVIRITIFPQDTTPVAEVVKKEYPDKQMTLTEIKSHLDFDIKFCKVQVGVFRSIFSIARFEQKFPLLKGRVEMEEFPEYNKFLMKETFLDLESAAELQKTCLFKYKSVDDTFIGVYTEEGERVLIYFDVESNLYVIVNSN